MHLNERPNTKEAALQRRAYADALRQMSTEGRALMRTLCVMVKSAESTSSSKRQRYPLIAAASKFQWSDGLLVVYLMVFVRQYLWGLENNAAAWIASVIISGALLSIHVMNREPKSANPGIEFWLIVGLPLTAVFSLRLPFPDINFDQMSYHLANSERALLGWPMKPGDFFPGVLLVNPAPDMVAGIGRVLLGYRMGTVVNLLAVLWAASSIELLFRNYIASKLTRSFAVLFVISSEHVLYLLNLYMIDLLALPLLIEALRLALNLQRLHNRPYAIIQIALFIGISVAFKLTNLAIAIPIIAVVGIEVGTDWRVFGVTPIVMAFAALLIPILPFSLYLYAETGSPIFPYYNNVFHSPFFPAKAIRDPLRGADGLLQTLLWPIWGWLKPTRLSAMSHGQHYLGKLSIAFLLSLAAIFVKGLGQQVRMLVLCTLAMTVLWSFSSGDMRYAIPIEITGGVLIVCLMSTAFRYFNGKQSTRWLRLFVAALSVQTSLVFLLAAAHREYYTTNDEWDSISQPTVFSQPLLYINEIKHVFSDRDPAKYIDRPTAALLSEVEIWINSIDATSGIEIASRPEVPIISLGEYNHIFDYMDSPKSRDRLREVLEANQRKRMFTLIQVPDFHEAISAIERSGLHATKVTLLEIPFYSRRIKLKLLLVQVALEGP